MSHHSTASRLRRFVSAMVLSTFYVQLFAPLAAHAQVPISNTPIGLGSSGVVKPNFMFILDDSGSMRWEFMPGNLGTFWNWSVGLYSHRCNTIYYNPNTRYELPPHPADPQNRRLPAPSGSVVAADGFAQNGFGTTSGSTLNLDAFVLGEVEDSRWSSGSFPTARPAYYYEWTGKDEPTMKECVETTQGDDPVNGNWRRVTVTDRANFSIWASFYRTRLLVMKSAAARAFAGVDDSLRVGLITIKPMKRSGSTYGDVDPNKYLAIKDFDAAQKQAWITKLYGVVGGGDTPLREALSRVGRHYAGRNDDINAGLNDDPVQYSCQRNYSMLTTDGYWTWSNIGPGFGIGRAVDGKSWIKDEDSDSTLPGALRDDYTALFRTRDITYTTIQTKYDATASALSACEAMLGTPRRTLAATGACADYHNIAVTEQIRVATPEVQWRPKGYSKVDWDYFWNWDQLPAAIALSSGSTTATGVTGCLLRSGRAVPAQEGGMTCATTDERSTIAHEDTWSSTSWSAPVEKPFNSSFTLADVAMYYYKNNLRSAAIGGLPNNRQTNRDVTTPDPTAAEVSQEADVAQHQRMVTFTMGFGVSGRVDYDRNYKAQKKDSLKRDFFDVAARTNGKGWLAPDLGDDTQKIDDLWHAALNGRGSYFSAGSSEDVIASLEATLAMINGRYAGGAAVGASNLEPTAANNYIYVPEYYFARWRGDVVKKQLNVSTGEIGAAAGSAAEKLAATVKADCDDRKIWLMKNKDLTDFSWSSHECGGGGTKAGARADGLAADLQKLFATNNLFPSLRDHNGAPPAPEALLNFLRGQSANELCQGSGTFRCRDTGAAGKLVLGDIVGSQPVYVKEPYFNYPDATYRAFKAAHTDTTTAAGAPVPNGRPATIYVGANDGMLHAFDAQTMEERWAIIPSAVWPRDATNTGFAQIATRNYGLRHRYSVDATPAVGDVFDGTAWRTVLIGGFNSGGEGYYALDITDPTQPKPLWELSNNRFADAAKHVGLSYGTPIITKREGDARWVAVVTSGYNSPTGRGVLYVLDALSGDVLETIDTGVGSAANQAGLAHAAAWTDNALVDSTARYVYSGDLLGNVWRFDIASDATARKANIASLKDASGVVQPITAAPELGRNGDSRMVFVATGKLLHESDLQSKQIQSVYGIVDSLATVATTITRDSLNQCSLTNTADTRTASCEKKSSAGWFTDLTTTERVLYQPRLQLGSLIFATNLPSEDVCLGGGSTYLHYVDWRTGGALATAEGGRVGHRAASGMARGVTLVKLPGGGLQALVSTTEGRVVSERIPTVAAATGKRRVAWREVGL